MDNTMVTVAHVSDMFYITAKGGGMVDVTKLEGCFLRDYLEAKFDNNNLEEERQFMKGDTVADDHDGKGAREKGHELPDSTYEPYEMGREGLVWGFNMGTHRDLFLAHEAVEARLQSEYGNLIWVVNEQGELEQVYE